MNYATLFFSSLAPGKTLRYFERNRHLVPFVDSLLLSDATGESFTRCLFTDDLATQNTVASDWMPSVGPELSKVFPPRVTYLYRQDSTSAEPARWGFTVWQDGAVLETAEHTIPPAPRQTLLSRLPGMKRNAPLSPDIAWALARGLPIDRVPAAGLRRHIPIIDYVTVAQLDQRSLLVENSPRLYRFPLSP